MLSKRSLRIKRENEHEKLHFALKKSYLIYFKHLIKRGSIKVCNNCYFLAQKNKDDDFLKILLEYDSSGINQTDDINLDTLLIKEVRYFNSRRFQLLMDRNVDVNKCNRGGMSPLHYALLNSKTPTDVIQKLVVELKANVNKVEVSREDMRQDSNTFDDDLSETFISLLRSPLACALFCQDDTKLDKFEKVKILVGAGADINYFVQHYEMHVLGLAVGFIKDFEILKYLLEHGRPTKDVILGAIRVGITSSLNWVEEDPRHLIMTFFLSAFDLLLKERIILPIDSDNCPLCKICSELEENNLTRNMNRPFRLLMVVLVQKQFELIEQDQVVPHDHKLSCILLCIRLFPTDGFIFPTIQHEILYNENNNALKNIYFRNYNTNQVNLGNNSPNTVTVLYNVSTIGMLVEFLPITEIQHWLKHLIKRNFDDNKNDALIDNLLRRFVHIPELTEELINITNYLMEQGYQVLSSLPSCSIERNVHLSTEIQIPFSVWLSAMSGNIVCLKKFLQYWNEEPLVIVLSIMPWHHALVQSNESYMLSAIESILPVLSECAGPLSCGTEMYNKLNDYITNCRQHRRTEELEAPYLRIANSLTELHKSPASLQSLCRTVIRRNAVGHGNNLPAYLKSLVPPGTGLPEFLACNF